MLWVLVKPAETPNVRMASVLSPNFQGKLNYIITYPSFVPNSGSYDSEKCKVYYTYVILFENLSLRRNSIHFTRASVE